MSLYVRLYTSFFSHRKTRRLRSAIGTDAFWVPVRLWAYAATNQPDGNFADYSPEDLCEGIGYTGDTQALVAALIEAGFLDPDLKVHGWAEHSGFHELYAARARKAANERWERERNKERSKERKKEGGNSSAERSGAELSKHSSSSSSSMLQASNGQSKPHFPPSFDRELENRIKRAESEIEKVKCKGILGDADRARIKTLRAKIQTWNEEILSRP